ncbi:MAG: hypothetical protein J6A79_16790 [Clostridia bacterium]|nr:hypothetical protein [Clostridia bacterium]
MEALSTTRRPWGTGSETRRESPHTILAAEVILMAVKDYVKILRRQIRYGAEENNSTEYEKQKLERFFRSDIFEFYTAFLSQPLDGDVLIRQCRLRAEEAERKATERKAEKNRGESMK